MKTIGLIGGMTWRSTAEYYKILNHRINERAQKLHSARILLYSFDFEEYYDLQKEHQTKQIENLLLQKATDLQSIGADCMTICSNTSSIYARNFHEKLDIPYIEIYDTVIDEINKRNLSKVGILGTTYLIESGVYQKKLQAKAIRSFVPKKSDQEIVHRAIFNEFPNGIFSDRTRSEFMRIIENLKNDGCEGVILGCTEIPILLKHSRLLLHLFDSVKIHTDALVEFALAKK